MGDIRRQTLLPFFVVVGLVGAGTVWPTLGLVAVNGESIPETVKFNGQIRPILSEHCFTCHGPDASQRKGDLRLDVKENVFIERDGYHLVLPGDREESELYLRVSSGSKELRMPPIEAGKRLSDREIELIGRWIDQGGEWQEHWSFVPPIRLPTPEVNKTSWAHNPIDSFVLARLEREGLTSSPESDRATLIRRASFDLIGLPPTPEEVEGFLADDSPNAYEKLIDRLLASPHYGERMAMEWLDAARYADTHGHLVDEYREMWRWRDWVIEAFNNNLPFDQFTIEQLAGDLLPGATLEEKIATGFNRNHTDNKFDAIGEEEIVRLAVDRLDTTATVWMGLTMRCGQCHDHKYDPITQREFYQFFAFFNNVPHGGLGPNIESPTPEQQRKLADMRLRIAVTERALTAAEDELATLQAEWEKATLSDPPLKPSFEGLVAHFEMEHHTADTSGHDHHGAFKGGEPTYELGKIGIAARLDGEKSRVDCGNVGDFERTDSFSYAFWIHPEENRGAPVSKMDELASSADRGFGLLLLRRGILVHFIHSWIQPTNAIRSFAEKPLSLGNWSHVLVTYDGSSKASGVTLYLDGRPEQLTADRDNLTGTIRAAAPLRIGARHSEKFDETYGRFRTKGLIDEVRIYDRELTSQEAEQLAIHHPMHEYIAIPTDQRTAEQRDELHNYFLAYHAPGRFRQLYGELKKRREQQQQVLDEIPTTLVMQEMAEPRGTFILMRGDYQHKTDEVTPDVPASLPPLPEGVSTDRLGLAKWLVDPAHPLTARVAVNRIWQRYFGTGIVASAEDFGSQGERPSHPDLLDWLATKFTGSSWDVKALGRTIVTSATYRQASRVTSELLERDHENRLLARGPRFRLSAELVRDSALAISGLLNSEIGGRSVFPYQPHGLWRDVGHNEVDDQKFTAQDYVQSQGKGLYRRSLYTFWKRSMPPPSLIAFDAPNREACAVRRARTNTPLQALVLMNDPTYVEAARALAERIMTEAGPGRRERVTHAFRLATTRRPAPAELEQLLEAFKEYLAEFRRDQETALKLVSVGESQWDETLDPCELAAWTAVARVILNLDETITKG